MPSFSLYGRKWHVGADDAPVFAAFGVLFHAFWLVLITYTAADLLAMPHVCTSQARKDIMAVAGLMICFVLGFVLEVSLIYEGCKGTIFQLSKRHYMGTLVTLRFIVVALETAMTAYGTYVVFFTSVECIVSETEQWNPQREIMVLIIMTWAFQALTLLNAFIWYNAWPEHHVPEQWENRFMWIGRWLCCQPSDAGQTRSVPSVVVNDAG
ncbi:hypothetical protein WJX84_007897 [Apatococcus fuscideae]|uniref:Uncharacterized protein n=1 Tax=Apatococcus fuscideae TaxID=2026836 RepID=A0AAW1SL24_9CHLO